MLLLKECLRSPFTLGCMLEAVLERAFRPGHGLAHGSEGSPHPSSPAYGLSSWLPWAASPFCVCLLGEHRLSVGPWEGRTPGFPQAGC